MNDKLIINLVPGDTFLHKLSGASKTRMFAALIVVTIMTFDVRILIPLFFISLVAFLSVKPDWKQVWWLIVLVVIVVKITATEENVNRVKEITPAPVQQAVKNSADSGKGMLEKLKGDINSQSSQHNDSLFQAME